MRRSSQAALLAALALAPTGCRRVRGPAPAAAGAPAREGLGLDPGVVRGVCYAHDWSDHGARGYGTASDAEQLRDVRRLGATWISVTPFAFLRSTTATQVRAGYDHPGGESDAGLAATIATAHALGLHVLVKPHLWVPGAWPGAIHPTTPAADRELMESWSAVTLHYADLAARTGAEGLTLGVEMDHVGGSDAALWRSLIARVRARYHGIVTYSANWSDAAAVPFWDALDVVAVNDYAPLSDVPGDAGASRDAVLRRAAEAVAAMAAVGRAVHRPVWLTELGFRQDARSLVEPWAWPEAMRDVPPAAGLQALGFEATFRAVAREPQIAGVFAWKWFSSGGTEDEGGAGFVFQHRAAEAVVAAAFAGGRR